MDRVTGKYSRLKAQNEREALLSIQRDQREKDALIFQQLEQRRMLERRGERLQEFKDNRKQTFNRDIQQYKDVQSGKRENVDFREKTQNDRTAEFKECMQKQRSTTDFKERMRSRLARTREEPDLER